MRRAIESTGVLAIFLFGIAAQAEPVLITAPITIGSATTAINPTAGGPLVPLEQADIIVRGTTLTINGRHKVASLRLERNAANVGATLTHDAGFRSIGVDGMWIEVGGDVFIQGAGLNGENGSLVNLSLRGYGPGGGVDSTYGPSLLDWRRPSMLGAGRSGRGGGAIHLVVGGLCRIDGSIIADGEHVGAYKAAGSGGSIWISAVSIQGSGLLRANGGPSDAYGSSGPGGNIAIEADVNFAGTTNCFGGPVTNGYNGRGAPGTVFRKVRGERLGTLLIDNGGGNPGITTFVGTSIIGADLLMTGSAYIKPLAGDDSLHICVGGSMRIDTGSGFAADGLGFAPHTGPGRGSNGFAAGYGGRGGGWWNGYGGVYGSANFPAEMGSGGDSWGGGYVRVSVADTMQLDGLVSAGGGHSGAYSGAGSGGGILIEAGRIAGSGLLRANCGTGDAYSWSGGGGRIAMRACEFESSVPTMVASGYESGSTAQIVAPAPVFAVNNTNDACDAKSETALEAFGSSSATNFSWRLQTGPGIFVPLSDGPFADAASGVSATIVGSTTPSLRLVGIRTGPSGRATFIASASGGCSIGDSNPIVVTICNSDLNCDGAVADDDFSMFAPAYDLLDCADPAMPSGCPADLNGDHVVDDADFSIFVVAYNELLCP